MLKSVEPPWTELSLSDRAQSRLGSARWVGARQTPQTIADGADSGAGGMSVAPPQR